MKLHRDPTRTTLLRRAYEGEMKRRFRWLSKQIWQFVVEWDVFGLDESLPFSINVERQAFRFHTDAQKIQAFRSWLQERVDQGILVPVGGDPQKPWTAKYLDRAYEKGISRSYDELNRQGFLGPSSLYLGGKQQFLRGFLGAPEPLSKYQLLYTRSFTELKGITEAMSQQISRTLADGLLKGKGPRAIARELSKNVEEMTRKRALVLARTEIIHAHAEGQLDAMKELGVEEITAQVEWITAGDERVCPDCIDLDGQVFSIDEAHGMIPLHPQCRCCWIPVVEPMVTNTLVHNIIRKIGPGLWRLYSRSGRNLGTFRSKAAAEKHEREVQYFKQKKS